MKLKKGDTVEVITGKDKGKQGEIAFVFPKTNKIIVNGINVASKHQRPQRANEPGGIIEKDMPLDASTVMLVHNGKEIPVRDGQPGPNRAKLQKALQDIQYGLATDTHGWLTEVG